MNYIQARLLSHAKASIANLSVDALAKRDACHSDTHSSGDDLEGKKTTTTSRMLKTGKLPLWTDRGFAERLEKFLTKCPGDEIHIDFDRVSRRRKVSPKELCHEGGKVSCLCGPDILGVDDEVEVITSSVMAVPPLPPPPSAHRSPEGQLPQLQTGITTASSEDGQPRK